jgi:UDP-glucose 6-dehydrogenase
MSESNQEYNQNIHNIDKISLGIVGLGILGTAIHETFKSFTNTIIKCYDKYKTNSFVSSNSSINYTSSVNSNLFQNSISIKCDRLKELCDCKIIFLCLPTEFDNDLKEYNKTEIELVCEQLALFKYEGIIMLKSTVEPTTTRKLSIKYKKIHPYFNIVHCPEFLSANTATEDFKNQKHIVIGIVDKEIVNKEIVNKEIVNKEIVNKEIVNTEILKKNLEENKYNNKYDTIQYLLDLFESFFPNAKISICSSNESESMKLFCNSFYATKIQYFTEIKLLCDKMEIDYNNVKDLMLQNGWINPMHTQIPGHDGNISFGGKCFPKDTKALNQVCAKMNISHKVIESVVTENIEMRGDL